MPLGARLNTPHTTINNYNNSRLQLQQTTSKATLPSPTTTATMSTTLIFGGSGKVALHLTRLLTTSSASNKVYNITRNAAHADGIKSAGGIPVEASIEDADVDTMTALLKKHAPDTVVFSAGAGGKGGAERTEAVDRDGAIRTMDATAKAGIKRYVIVSAIDVRDKDKEPEWYKDEDRERSAKMRNAIGRYVEAKFQADKSLVTENGRRKLDYTIVRPGGLSEDKGTGKIAAGKVSLVPSIPREDVARVIFAAINNPKTIGLAFDVVGGDTPVEEAIEEVASKKIDTFEGHY